MMGDLKKRCISPSHQKIGDFRLPAILPKPRECCIFLGKDSSFWFSLSRPGLPCEVDSKDRELLKVQAPPAVFGPFGSGKTR